MSRFDYNYNNFISGVNTEKLSFEIKNQITKPFYLSVYGNMVSVVFDTSLSASEVSTLDSIIAAHDATIAVFSNANIGNYQRITANVQTQTTSSNYVDLDSMTITTSSNDEEDYLLLFSCNAQSSVPSRNIYYTFNIDGIDQIDMTKIFYTELADNPIAFSMSCLAKNINNGSVIKVRWSTDGRSPIMTASTDEREFFIRGLNKV